MPLTDRQIRSLVESASVGAVAFQAQVLIRELEGINDVEYPQEARQIRDVLICWPEFILNELWQMQQKEPMGVGGSAAVRLRSFGKVLHDLYSFIRYLTASTPRQAPPAIQYAVNRLIDRHFPKSNGAPVCVIRPQWKYNLKYVPLTWYLRDLISPGTLDTNDALGLSSKADILTALWEWRRAHLSEERRKQLSPNPPSQLAILSFAGLDTYDSLLYPLLAHELGHFIDYSFSTPLNLDPKIQLHAHIAHKDVEAVLIAHAAHLVDSANDIWKTLVDRVNVCLRELLADLLALRMMGFAFFAAQTEFLKTIAAWPETLLTPSGYPGTRFRVWSILRHLLDPDFPGNIQRFISENPSADIDLRTLDNYIKIWVARTKYDTTIEAMPGLSAKGLGPRLALEQLAERAVLASVDSLVQVAKDAIPRDRCASLNSTLYERIIRLRRDLPPVCNDEQGDAFPEILSAAWAYQIVYGEERELAEAAAPDRLREYEKTCRLLHKAIELVPDGTKAPLAVEPNPPIAAPGVLGARHLAQRIASSVTDDAHLAIVPRRSSAIGAASLDVHLGNWFALARKSRLSKVRLEGPDERLLTTVGREEVFVPNGKTFIIHPGDLVLGSTLEFVALPGDLMAFVEGRSSIGRLGLIVATASQVAPGFHGVIVLELANAGTVPLEISPGMPVAQLVFMQMSETLPIEKRYTGRFYCQVKP